MSSEAAEILAKALEADAAAQERGEIESIGSQFDEVLGEILPINDIPEQVFGMAFSFWDCWLDSKNHNWLYHDPVAESDWPSMARTIAASVRNFSIPLNPTIRRLFVQMPGPPKVSIFRQIKSWLSARA